MLSESDQVFAVYGSHVNLGLEYGQVASGSTTADVTCIQTIDVSTWDSGIIAIAVQIGAQVQSFQFFKP